MALSNLFGWSKKTEAAAPATACGAGDKPAEKPAACGSACGAGDKPAESPRPAARPAAPATSPKKSPQPADCGLRRRRTRISVPAFPAGYSLRRGRS